MGSLYPRERATVPGWTPGSVWKGAENFAPTGIEYPERPARSESLHRLSYPSPRYDVMSQKKQVGTVFAVRYSDLSLVTVALYRTLGIAYIKRSLSSNIRFAPAN